MRIAFDENDIGIITDMVGRAQDHAVNAMSVDSAAAKDFALFRISTLCDVIIAYINDTGIILPEEDV